MARCVSFMTLLALTSLFSALEAYENFVAFSKNVTLREDVPVGATVLHLTDFVNVSQNFNEEEENGTSWTVNVTTGDDFGQFGVDVVNLTLFVAASLDYELNPRYNLSLELTNPLGRSFHHVNLVVTVVDVPGYPPYYNKRCETPVLPDSGATEDYMSGQCKMVEGARYFMLIEVNEIWHTPSYWVQCDAVIRLVHLTVPVKTIHQFSITGCPEGRYGLYCDKRCVCKNRARCHGFNGACECRPGWRGRACDIRCPRSPSSRHLAI
ncbi:Endothelial cell-specific molecule 1 [Branchiostoma belcheri]|nr:Endothelial cell-specific molecule 1 [Branchiostoma belcheri]